MATIYIDNQPYEVEDGQNLLHACLSLGFNIPYFCWHPAMGSVGSCRLCAVKQFKDENDTEGKIIMSCMAPATDGVRISIDDIEAAAFRKSVIEWLMINHPHDCPICDEGGECHLQDMTVMTGHNYRRYRFNKRTYRNQYLGPFINHEMNRCIQCYRCVRFYRDYAGGNDLQVFGAHDHIYFGRHKDGVLENEFSGNLVEVCPTGVFTDKTLKNHYTRKWDLQTAPSICVHCGLGCNTIPGERYGSLRRIRARYNGQVNGYFLCDRGRYGYEFVNSENRIIYAYIREGKEENLKPVPKNDAIQKVQSIRSQSKGTIGIGSPRASLESNFALRSLVGKDRFFTPWPEQEQSLISSITHIMQNGPARSPSLHKMKEADAVFVLGEDLTNTAPMMALALRQAVRHQVMEISRKMNIPDWHDAAVRDAVQNEKGYLYIACPFQTKLDVIATQSYYAAPQDIARLGFAVAHELSQEAPAVHDLPEELRSLSREIAKRLKEAKRPLIVSGSSLESNAIVKAAANVAWALCRDGSDAQLSYVVPECNSLGLGLMGGGYLEEAVQRLDSGGADTVIVLENDLYRRSWKLAETLFEKAKHLIVLDYLQNSTTEKAEVIFPTSTFAEESGTLVNNEGRAQRFFQVMVPDKDIQESWRWIGEITPDQSKKNWKQLDDVIQAIAEKIPVFKNITQIAPSSEFRIAGEKIPRQLHRYSGRTAMHSHIDVHEPPPQQDTDSPMVFSMEGFQGQPPASLIKEFWSPGWNSVQAINKFQSEIGGPLHGGGPGQRLIECSQDAEPSFFTEVPLAFVFQENEWLLIPFYQIFGSEELSVHSPNIAERSTHCYLGMNPDDMKSLQITEKEYTEVKIDESEYQLSVQSIMSLPKGVSGLAVGLPGLSKISFPQQVSISRSKQQMKTEKENE